MLLVLLSCTMCVHAARACVAALTQGASHNWHWLACERAWHMPALHAPSAQRDEC